MRAQEFIAEKKLMSKKDDPCQPGYRMLGMKNKGGRKVPNCIPETQQGVAEGTSKVTYTKPNFDREWEEAERYPEFQKAGKDTWINIAKQGSVAKWSELRDVGNVDTDLSGLERDKIKRAGTMVGAGKVELPIVGRWPDGYLDLIAGNTRIATLLSQGHDPKVWVVDVPEEQGVAEGPIGKAVGATVGAVTGAALGTIGAAVTGKPSKIYKGAKKGAKLGKKVLGWA